MAPKRNQQLTEKQKQEKAALRKLAAERDRRNAKTDPKLAKELEEKKRLKAEAEQKRRSEKASQISEQEKQRYRRNNNGLQSVYIDESQSSQSQVTPNTKKQQARRSDPSKYTRDLHLKRLQNQRRSLRSVSSISSQSSAQNTPATQSIASPLSTQLTAFTFNSATPQSSQTIVISQSQSQATPTFSESTVTQSQPTASQNNLSHFNTPQSTPRSRPRSCNNTPFTSLKDFIQREVAKRMMEKHVKELEHYCFDDKFLQPVTESHVLLRRKQLCRIRVHHSFATQAGDEFEMFQEYDDVDATVLDNEVFIRQCDLERCPDMTDAMVMFLDDVLFNILYSLKYKFYEKAQTRLSQVYTDLGNQTLLDFLQKFYGCYMGIRTCYNKIQLIRKSLDVILSPDEIEFNDLPKFIQFQIIRSSDREETEAGITEAQALRRFANEFTKFRQNESDIETAECQVCRYLCRKSLVKEKVVNFNIQFLPPEIRLNYVVRACESCRKSLSKGYLPTYAVMNGFELKEIPRCMKELNFIGKNLIQLVKPIIGTYSVTDKRGVANGMRGKQGVGTFHAVPVDDTAAYLATHLPNLDNMLVQIDSMDNSFVGQVVNLQDVFESLYLLKFNNPRYANITIDNLFYFEHHRFDLKSQLGNPHTEESLVELDITGTTAKNMVKVNRVPGQGAETCVQRYMMRKHEYDPISIDGKFLDALMFPWLLPNGLYGWDHPREGNVTMKMYNRARLMCVDRRFATDKLYVLVVASIIEQQQLTSSISIALRQSKEKITCKDVMALLRSNKTSDHVLFSSLLSEIRGYAGYWYTVAKILRSFCQVFGRATWFLTFSPNIRGWLALHQSYSEVHGIVVDANNIHDMVAKDPLIFTRFFQGRLNAVWRFIHSDAEPLGKVIQSFYRKEYQENSLTHAHCFLWIKDPPAKEETAAFIDRYVTCRKPNEVREPELYKIWNEYQRHHTPCSPTCLRSHTINGLTYEKCRFDFPRLVVSKTIIHEDFGCHLKNNLKRSYSVARNAEEAHINEYNAAISLMWGGNTDISFIHGSMSTPIEYTTHYATKETSFDGSILQKKMGEEIKHDDLFKIGVDMLKRKKMPPTEAIDIVMGHSLYQFSNDHIFINTNASNQRKRVLVAENLLKDMSPNARAYVENVYDDYYPNRPTEMNDVSLFSFVISFGVEYYQRKKSGKQDTTRYAKNTRGNNDTDDDFIVYDGGIADETYKNGPFYHSKYHPSNQYSPFYDFRHLPRNHRIKLKNGDKEVVKLSKQLVPDTYFNRVKPEDRNSREDFYRRCCMQFIPWRNEDHIKSFTANVNSAYEDTWEAYIDELKTNHPRAYKDIERYLSQYQLFYQEEREMFDKLNKKSSNYSKNESDKSAKDYLLNFDRGLLSAAEIEEDVKALQDDQKEIYDSIIKFIHDQDDATKPESRRWLVSGAGGFGKSHLIEVLDQKLTLEYSPSKEDRFNAPAVMICAPTGRAAVTVKGYTCHSLLGITVDNFYPLSGDRLDALRNQTRNCKLLVIDEISQCSNELLAKISLRFQEITGIDEPFGNIPTLLVGDFLQLPPVDGSFCFEPLSSSTIKRISDSGATSYDLWQSLDIHYFELWINKRQYSDLNYAEVLGRIRVGTLTDDDYDFLLKHVVPPEEGTRKDSYVQELYHDLSTTNPTTLVLYSKNEMVETFNKRYLLSHFKDELVSIPPVHVRASESDDNDSENETGFDQMKKKQIRRRIYQQARYKLTRSKRYSAPKPKRIKYVATLVKTINLAVGVRVMLVYNTDLKNRLVNGTIGTVTELEYSKKDTSKVISVVVKFDNIKQAVHIRRIVVTIKGKRNDDLVFKQFPLTLAFATTIHKSQSISLSTAIISLENVFAPGQAYVALSRLQSATGLYLLNCPKGAFKCNQMALTELNRLRTSAGLAPRQTTITWRHALKARRRSPVAIDSDDDSQPKRPRRTSSPGPLTTQPQQSPITPTISHQSSSLHSHGSGACASTTDIPSFQGITFRDPDLDNARNLQRRDWASNIHIQAFHAAYIPHLTGMVFRRIAFLDPLWQQGIRHTPMLRFVRMFKNNLDLIQCPIHIHANHWGLLSIVVHLKLATWYDPMMASWNSQMDPEETRLCNLILNTLKTANLISNNTVLVFADYYSFNQQRDGNSCGWHVCLISEDIARYGHSIRWPNLRIMEERSRMYRILSGLFDVNSNGGQPQTLPQWPDQPNRGHNVNVHLATQPQLPARNNSNGAHDILRLRNRRTDCFMISAVNLINIADDFKTAILNDVSDVNTIAKVHLAEILRGEVNNVHALRNDFVAFQNHRNQESALFLIMNELTDEEKGCITFFSTKYTSCLCDNGAERVSLEDRRKTVLNLNATANVVNTLDSMVENIVRDDPDALCEFCNGPFNVQYRFEIPQEQRYLYVEVNSFVYYQALQTREDINRESLDIDNFIFSNTSWKLLGLVEYLGNNKGGHYKTWKRARHGWIIQDDDYIDSAPELHENLNTYPLMLFERNL
uniref:ATP-dependent DNA helicase n=1 Tax=Panagrolaimus davidi TaxID=227884 RepID=A0A914P577_9BILA